MSAFALIFNQKTDCSQACAGTFQPRKCPGWGSDDDDDDGDGDDDDDDDDDGDDDGDDDDDDDDDDLGDVHFFRRTVKRCTSGGVYVPSIYTHAM